MQMDFQRQLFQHNGAQQHDAGASQTLLHAHSSSQMLCNSVSSPVCLLTQAGKLEHSEAAGKQRTSGTPMQLDCAGWCADLAALVRARAKGQTPVAPLARAHFLAAAVVTAVAGLARELAAGRAGALVCRCAGRRRTPALLGAHCESPASIEHLKMLTYAMLQLRCANERSTGCSASGTRNERGDTLSTAESQQVEDNAYQRGVHRVNAILTEVLELQTAAIKARFNIACYQKAIVALQV